MRKSFKGTILHSALWSDDIKLDGKHVAVIGTGATSMQLVPAIAGRVASVTVYQRSAQWARPVKGYADPISEGARWLLAHLPFYVQWYRFNMFWRYGDGLLPFLRKDPAWPHPERAVNKGNDRHRQELTDFILTELKDRPDLIEKCVPTYPPYGKRILLDNNWFKTLRQDNVELVTDAIDHFDESGIVTADGEHRPADIIVVATGFKVTEMAARLNISGRDGKNLREAWANDNPTAFLGLTVPDFPELLLHARPELRASPWRQRHLPVGMPEPLHLRLPRRHDRARRRRDRRSSGGARRLCPQGRCRARGDDLDSSRHEHLLPQLERPRVFGDALAVRGLLAHDTRSGSGAVQADEGVGLAPLRRQPASHRRKLHPETFRHRLVGDAAAMDVQPVAQMRFSSTAAKPLLASIRPNGSVALFSAWLDVTGTAPGMLATQ